LDAQTLTTDEVIRRGLIFAKESPLDQEIAKAIVYYHYKGIGGSQTRTYLDKQLQKYPKDLHEWWAGKESQRMQFRSRLTQLFDLPKTFRRRKKKKDIEVVRRDLVIITSLDDEGEKEYLYCPVTSEAAYIYVLMLLQKPKNIQHLRRCANADCNAFFYGKTGEKGGRPRKHCSSECQSIADNKNRYSQEKTRKERLSK